MKIGLIQLIHLFNLCRVQRIPHFSPQSKLNGGLKLNGVIISSSGLGVYSTLNFFRLLAYKTRILGKGAAGNCRLLL